MAFPTEQRRAPARFRGFGRGYEIATQGGLPRDQADDLSAGDQDAAGCRFPAYGIEYAPQGCLLEVGQVRGNLHQIPAGERDTHGFYKGEPTGGGADFAGDGLGNGKIGGVEVHVKSDQQFSRADDAGSRGGVQGGTAQIGHESGVLKSSAADMLEWNALGSGRGSFIEIDRDTEPLPDILAGAVGESRAIFERSAAQGDERNHVRGADAGMDSVVMPQINTLHGGGDPAHGGFTY